MHSLQQNPNLPPELWTTPSCLVNSGSCVWAVHRKEAEKIVFWLQQYTRLDTLFLCTQQIGKKNQQLNLSNLCPRNHFVLCPSNIAKLTGHIRRTVKNAVWCVSAPATTQALKSDKPFWELNRDWQYLYFVVPTFWTLSICHETYDGVGKSPVSTGPLCESRCPNKERDTVSSSTNVKCVLTPPGNYRSPGRDVESTQASAAHRIKALHSFVGCTHGAFLSFFSNSSLRSIYRLAVRWDCHSV